MNREQKKQATLQRITDVALRLFSERGYEETSVAEIAEAAGVAKGTFFNYFPTKEDLLFKLQKIGFLNELLTLGDRPGPYAPLIMAFVKELGDSMAANPALMRSALQRFLAAGSLEKNRANHEAKVKSIAELIDKGQQSGEFAQTAQADALALNALQIYYGTLVTWSTGEDRTGLGEQLSTAFRIFLNGIMQK